MTLILTCTVDLRVSGQAKQLQAAAGSGSGLRTRRPQGLPRLVPHFGWPRSPGSVTAHAPLSKSCPSSETDPSLCCHWQYTQTAWLQLPCRVRKALGSAVGPCPLPAQWLLHSPKPSSAQSSLVRYWREAGSVDTAHGHSPAACLAPCTLLLCIPLPPLCTCKASSFTSLVVPTSCSSPTVSPGVCTVRAFLTRWLPLQM